MKTYSWSRSQCTDPKLTEQRVLTVGHQSTRQATTCSLKYTIVIFSTLSNCSDAPSVRRAAVREAAVREGPLGVYHNARGHL